MNYDYLNGLAINFSGFNCALRVEQYENGRPALRLVDRADGSPVATCSVNMPDVPLVEGEICIKDYSENEGMLKALVAHNVVFEMGFGIPSGFVVLPVCKLRTAEEWSALYEEDDSCEGGEDAACGSPCGQEPMGCGSCGEMGGSDPYAYGDYDDARHW